MLCQKTPNRPLCGRRRSKVVGQIGQGVGQRLGAFLRTGLTPECQSKVVSGESAAGNVGLASSGVNRPQAGASRGAHALYGNSDPATVRDR